MAGLPLSGCRVLVPRGGEFGTRLAERVEELGGVATVAPLIGFAPPEKVESLHGALEQLTEGRYDWLVLTSATTVEALGDVLGEVPSTTRVAAVGPATAAAVRAQGSQVHLMPESDYSALGLLAVWPSGPSRVLLPQSEIAAETLTEGLSAHGADVDAITAYRTVPVPISGDVLDSIWGGRIDAVLLTSGSTARQLKAQCAPVPETTLVVCIGESTATAATEAGLRVDAIAARSEGESLIQALVGLTS